MNLRSAVVILHSVLSMACFAQPATVSDPTQSDPIAYLNRALDEMQAHSLERNAVDWPRLRAEAIARAAGARNTVATYDAIRYLLLSLGDHHSSLHLTPALEALEAQEKVAHPSEALPHANRENFSPYVGRYGAEGHIEHRSDRTVAFVVVTKCFPENDREFVEFETKLQRVVADLGDDLGEFFDVDGHSVWRYHDGVAAEVAGLKVDAYPAIDGKPYHLAGTPEVAVLIDRSTGSSGEALAVAFRGRPRTRFFGEHTQGASTVNETFQLSDGASMWLTIGVQADRNGKQYADGLVPDQAIPGDNQARAPADDPVVQAALTWLCRTPETAVGSAAGSVDRQ